MTRLWLAVGLLSLGFLSDPTHLAAQCDRPLDLGRGPIGFNVPDDYDPAVPASLVLALHTFGGSGARQESYLQLEGLSETLGFLYAYPDGTVDANGDRFWNATDACCDLFASGVDDSSYLRSLIETIASRCNVDRRRIYLIGQSNGAYMSYRMACDHADTLAGIVTIAGATYFDAAACKPSRPVDVLHVHGTKDATWLYEGGTFLGNRYPGAEQSVARWAGYNTCRSALEPIPGTFDLEADVPGEESRAARYSGCATGGSVELWTTRDGPHIFAVSPGFTIRLLAHLLARPAPLCRGAERIRRAVCRDRQRRLVLKLAGGLNGDGFEARLSGHGRSAGRLDQRGRARLTLTDIRCSDGLKVAVTWGCGATSAVAVD